ncbi:MAG: hypothetical protein AAGM38_02870 [Pseudomonadota bacterium]
MTDASLPSDAPARDIAPPHSAAESDPAQAPSEPNPPARVLVASTPDLRPTARRLAAALPQRIAPRVAPPGAPTRLNPQILPMGDALDIDLSREARGALREADHLVVICSASAAEDRWIDEAIRTFLALKGDDAPTRRLHLVSISEEAATPPAASEVGATRLIPLGVDRTGWRSGTYAIVASVLGVEADPFVTAATTRLRRARITATLTGLALVLAAIGLALFFAGDI